MNATEIRAAHAAWHSHWEILAMLVNAGVEFPDAQFKVTQALRLDPEQVAEMIDAYDNNC